MALHQENGQENHDTHELSAQVLTAGPETSFIRLVSRVMDSQLADQQRIEIINDTAKAMEALGVGVFRREVTHALLIIIWRQIHENFQNSQWSLAQKWCHLVLDTKLFGNCSRPNQLKIQKKLVACALNTGNTVLARQSLNQITHHESLESRPETWFLTYKLALQEGSGPPQFPNVPGSVSQRQLLQLCTLEAQRLKKTSDTMKFLGAFLEQTYPETTDGRFCDRDEQLFPLYVLSVEMQKNEIDDTLVETMVNLLERVVGFAQCSQNVDTLPDADLEWACRGSYTLSLTLLRRSQTKHVVAVLEIAGKLLQLYRERPSSNHEIVEKLSLFIPCLKVWVSCTKCAQLPPPPEGFGHLATVSFNQALGFYADKEDEEFWHWVKRAFQLVGMMNTTEGDQLAKMFQDRLDGLCS